MERLSSLPGVVAVALCGVATAAPPGGPLSEGREVDPVVRDFQLNEPVVPEGAAPSRSPEKPGDTFVASVLAALGDAILNRLTIPLGTVSPAESR